ncbi:prepilin peptidase [Nitrospirales bacterium NOB]|nr:prepilin peptidase [Nitrospira sp. NTP2]MDL1888302.1 prepilin peptidase [Nitrospirales bacterium NOB]RIK57964.1 MAG: prepilin peptidase [Nitrospira sp.]
MSGQGTLLLNESDGTGRANPMMAEIVAAALTGVLVTAMWTDLRSSRIPNSLTFPAMVFALIVHTWFSGGQGLMFSLTGLGAGWALFMVLYVSGSIGAGDVKLMAAVGAFIGPYGAVVSGVLALMVGGVYALGAMYYQWGVVGASRKLVSAMQGAVSVGGKAWTLDLMLPFRLRYGLAIAGGTLLFHLGFRPFGG